MAAELPTKDKPSSHSPTRVTTDKKTSLSSGRPSPHPLFTENVKKVVLFRTDYRLPSHCLPAITGVNKLRMP
jgi:hypothetical protein